MLRALLYLRITSFKNGLLSRVRRLRQPKYFIGAVVGFAYFYFFFFRPLQGPIHSAGSTGDRTSEALASLGVVSAALPVDGLPLASAVGALALLFLATCMWVIPTERAALGFSGAEIAFLFPAPITRRSLVHFRLLTVQFRSLFGAGIMMLFSNRWTFLGGSPLTHAIGWWFVFSGLNLHLTGARFTLTRLADGGVSVWLRRVLALVFVGGFIAVTFARLPVGARWPVAGSELSFQPVADWLLTLAQTAPLSWLLWPFQLALGPFLAADTPAFLLALVPAAAVIMLHYLWVVRSAVAFEDGTLEQAEKRAARVAAWRSGHRRIRSVETKPRRAPFPLPAMGRPEIAFLWKNLLSTWPYFTWRVLLACAVAIALGGAWFLAQPASVGVAPALGAGVMIFALYTLIVGPQFARQDIRSDLANADILKTYPLAGWQVVLGQLLTPVAILTGILWLALLAAAMMLPSTAPGFAWLTPGLRITAGIGFAIITPALIAVQLLVPNAAALFFPGWFHTSRTRGGGPEVIGQRMIFFFAQLLTMIAALLPAMALGAAVIALAQWVVGAALAITLGTSAVLVILVGEVAGGVWLLGRRFEQLDLSAELRA